jgi:hypothetical protein
VLVISPLTALMDNQVNLPLVCIWYRLIFCRLPS